MHLRVTHSTFASHLCVQEKQKKEAAASNGKARQSAGELRLQKGEPALVTILPAGIGLCMQKLHGQSPGSSIQAASPKRRLSL